MRNCGINASLSNGRITLSTNGQTHISGEGNINLVWDVLGLDLANDFFTQAYTTIRSTTTFEELGFVPDDGASNKIIILKYIIHQQIMLVVQVQQILRSLAALLLDNLYNH